MLRTLFRERYCYNGSISNDEYLLGSTTFIAVDFAPNRSLVIIEQHGSSVVLFQEAWRMAECPGESQSGSYSSGQNGSNPWWSGGFGFRKRQAVSSRIASARRPSKPGSAHVCLCFGVDISVGRIRFRACARPPSVGFRRSNGTSTFTPLFPPLGSRAQLMRSLGPLGAAFRCSPSHRATIHGTATQRLGRAYVQLQVVERLVDWVLP